MPSKSSSMAIGVPYLAWSEVQGRDLDGPAHPIASTAPPAATRSASIDARVRAALDDLDDSSAVLVIEANGRVFSAGHDLCRDGRARRRLLRRTLRPSAPTHARGARDPQPVIAKVQGGRDRGRLPAGGGVRPRGRVRGRQFATPGVSIGLFCSTPMVPLTRASAAARAPHAVHRSTRRRATALDWGLVNEVVPAAELDAAVDALSRRSCASARGSSASASGRSTTRSSEPSPTRTSTSSR